jgi:hypothetical protein
MTDRDLPNHGTPWTSDEEKHLRDLYPDTDSTELVQEFGRTYEAIKARAKKLNISKSEDYQTPIESDEVIQRGADAEKQFESYANGFGWTWFKNSVFRNYPSREREYESISAQVGLENEEWYTDQMKRRGEAKKQELEAALDKPDWFLTLREELTEVLDTREPNWTAYPDYIIGDWPNEPGFVEVKYGSSNLSQKQHAFFDFLRGHDYPIKIFRVSPSGEKRLYKWDGGWK